jgi:hypothetical protein
MQTLKAPWRVGLLALTVALVCAGPPSPTRAASAASPLARLLADPGNRYLCFRRVYDTAHLRRHPGQLTTSVLVSLDPAADNSGQTAWLKMELHLKGRPSPAHVGASCEWGAKANRDTSGRRLIAGYPREDGFACTALYSNQAAEEAGTLMLDLTADGRTAMVYFRSEGIGLWGTYPEHTAPDEKTGAWKRVPGIPPLKVGAEDRVFRLTRTGPAACGDMERSIDLSKG